MADFQTGTQAKLCGLKGEAALNGQGCVSLGPSGTNGRILVRLGTGRELAVRPDNLLLAGAAGTLPVGSTVILAGLAKAPSLNGQQGKVVGRGDVDSGRLLVEIISDDPEAKSDAKSLKADNLVLSQSDPIPEEPTEEASSGFDMRNEREKVAQQKNDAAIKACPVGARARIEGLVEEKGRDDTGDPALNGEEGTADKIDPDEPGRLIMRLAPKKCANGNMELRLRSIHYKNLVRLDTPKEDKPAEPVGTALQIHSGAHGKRKEESQAVQILGAGGKRCKIAEIAVAAGDKTAAFASAARNRDVPAAGSGSDGDNAAARSNALIYARTDVTSSDDDVAAAGVSRLLQLCPNFAMKAVCVLGRDVAANGSGKIGSKSSETIEGLAAWLTGGESDGILRKQLKEGQACAGEKDGISACRRCAEKGCKGGRLLGLVRKNSSNIKEFVGRGCKER